MTEIQLLQALKARLLAHTWTGGGVVFGSGCVAIMGNTQAAIMWALSSMRTPFAIIKPGATAADPQYDEDPNFVQLNVNVLIGVMVPGDVGGENAMLGANKTGGSTSSAGRGIFEVEQELFNAIGELNALESVTLQCRHKGAADGFPLENGNYVAYREYQFETLGTMV